MTRQSVKSKIILFGLFLLAIPAVFLVSRWTGTESEHETPEDRIAETQARIEKLKLELDVALQDYCGSIISIGSPRNVGDTINLMNTDAVQILQTIPNASVTVARVPKNPTH